MSNHPAGVGTYLLLNGGPGRRSSLDRRISNPPRGAPHPVGTDLLFNGYRGNRPGRLELAQSEAPPQDARRFSTELRPPVVPQPRPRTKEELIREAQKDEITAKRGERWADTADDISENSDLDPFDAEYVDHYSGGKWVETIRDGATVASVILRHDAKLRAERARRDREEARKRPR